MLLCKQSLLPVFVECGDYKFGLLVLSFIVIINENMIIIHIHI